MIDIEIDGKKIQANDGAMIIEAADAAGIHIPRFCYHKKLSIAANCRMCLIEVDKVKKPLPACATPVTPGMVIKTKSLMTRDAQRAVMEFLLINHPLDCPICDQGGECELQDVAIEYGSDHSRFTEGKNTLTDHNIGPLINTFMTRCINCTRCVRFGTEVAGVRELGVIGRGESARISTYVEHIMESEIAGNIIDLCPVGALTSKPFLYRARAWELNQYPSVSIHDCVGTNLHLHTLHDQVLRVVPRENEEINEVWIADRDRFSYLGLYSDDRLQSPMIKQQGKWQTTDWQTALNFAAESLQKVVAVDGAEQLAALISPNSTLEEFYLLQKLIRGLGSNNIDHRLRETDTSDQTKLPTQLGLGVSLAELEQQDAVLLIGSYPRHEQPLLNQRLHKACNSYDCQVMAINSIDFAFNYLLSEKIITAPANLSTVLAGVAKALGKTSDKIPSLLSAVTMPSAIEKAIAKQLTTSNKKTIILGAMALQHPQAAAIRALANFIAELSGATVGYLTEGGNANGAWLAGAIPHHGAGVQPLEQIGHDARQMITETHKAYLLFGIDPELDCANPAKMRESLQEAALVIAMATHNGSGISDYADVILPITPAVETSGTYINTEGKWQTVTAATKPYSEARPGWKVLRVLANVCELDGFDYVSSIAVRDELQAKTANAAKDVVSLKLPTELTQKQFKISRITTWPIYATDCLVRRAKALQATPLAPVAAVHINAKLAEQLNIKDGELVQVTQAGNAVQLPAAIDERVADDCGLIHGGMAETAMLGESFGEIELHKV